MISISTYVCVSGISEGGIALCVFQSQCTGSDYWPFFPAKTFFKLNSAEHEIAITH